MDGRMRAYREEDDDDDDSDDDSSRRRRRKRRETIDVPPVSILNAANCDVIGLPEITMLDDGDRSSRLMRWTCMYNALLHQDHLRVDDFPHDSHALVLKLAVLAHRRPGGVWDKNKWILDLATERDSQGSTEIPHGLLVDHVRIPDFNLACGAAAARAGGKGQGHGHGHGEGEGEEGDGEGGKASCAGGLEFEFVPLPLGSGEKQRTTDVCLRVTLHVSRESRHYDRNIVPLVVLLNVVAVTCLVRTFDSATASTELMLGIAFVEIGVRLTVDSRLPSVGYEIKILRTLNRCFWLLCYLVVETNVVFFPREEMEMVYRIYDELDRSRCGDRRLDVHGGNCGVLLLLLGFSAFLPSSLLVGEKRSATERRQQQTDGEEKPGFNWKLDRQL